MKIIKVTAALVKQVETVISPSSATVELQKDEVIFLRRFLGRMSDGKASELYALFLEIVEHRMAQ